MIVKVYAIFDKKVGTFMMPFNASHAQIALRSFEQALNSKDTVFNTYPEDFSLWQLGDFNDETGEYSKSHAHIGEGCEFVKRVELNSGINIGDSLNKD